MIFGSDGVGAPSVRALAAALRRMPALRALMVEDLRLPTADLAQLFCAETAGAAPQLHVLFLKDSPLVAAVPAIAATSWRLKELDFFGGPGKGDVAALVASPTFALSCLALVSCDLDVTALLALAGASWPLEELYLMYNDFSGAGAAPALAALSRHARLRKLDVGNCRLSAAGFKALIETGWQALTSLGTAHAAVAFAGPHALGAAAFAGFPSLEQLQLPAVAMGEAGARLLASRRWPRLVQMDLSGARLGAPGLAALARGARPALMLLDLRCNRLPGAPTLEAARRWAPALAGVLAGDDE